MFRPQAHAWSVKHCREAWEIFPSARLTTPDTRHFCWKKLRPRPAARTSWTQLVWLDRRLLEVAPRKVGFRRVSPVAPRPREGPLTEPTAGAQPEERPAHSSYRRRPDPRGRCLGSRSSGAGGLAGGGSGGALGSLARIPRRVLIRGESGWRSFSMIWLSSLRSAAAASSVKSSRMPESSARKLRSLRFQATRRRTRSTALLVPLSEFSA